MGYLIKNLEKCNDNPVLLIVDFLLIFIEIAIGYFIFMFFMTWIFNKIPRRNVDDYPDWGRVEDRRIKAINGKEIELWVVYPDSLNEAYDEDPQDERISSNPAVIITHGWGRNRGRSVFRARHWNSLNYTTIIISVRDHGNSDKELRGMSIVRFSHDIESVLNWWGKPALLLGHSIAGGASILSASRNPLPTGLIAEAPVWSIPEDLTNIYRPLLKQLTPLFMPGIRFWLRVMFRKYSPQDFSPAAVVDKIKVPTLLLHGELDPVFPPSNSIKLSKLIENSSYHVFDLADHSTIPEQEEYPKVLENFIEANKLSNQS